ncbi:MAG: hypothetical protein AAFQ82_06030, partial [Myxococcota bacterium]
MEWVFAVVGGIGLAAACGFRVFLPPFLTSLAACGYLGETVEHTFVHAARMEWLGQPPVAL